MESQPQNSKFRNNPKNFHPFGTETSQDDIGPIGSSCFLSVVAWPSVKYADV